MNRRKFIVAPVSTAIFVFAGAGFTSKSAHAFDPIITTGLVMAIIPSMVQAITGIINFNKGLVFEQERAEAQKKVEQARLIDEKRTIQARQVFEWLAMGVANKDITYQAATEAYRKTLANLHISNNIDGADTIFQVKDGAIYLERNGTGGTLHAAAGNFSAFNKQMTGTLAVPVDYAREIDRSEKHKAIKSIADSVNMSDTDFNQRFVLHAKRPFSSANNPTVGGADANLYAIFNRDGLNRGNSEIGFMAS